MSNQTDLPVVRSETEVKSDRNADRRNLLFRNVRGNAGGQIDAQHRENYFRSCEAHGGELAEIVSVVRGEFPQS